MSASAAIDQDREQYDITQLGFAFTFNVWLLERERALLALVNSQLSNPQPATP